MSKKTAYQKAKYSHVRLKSLVIDKVKKHKGISGIPIGRFFEDAALEKLERVNFQKNHSDVKN